MNKDYWEIREEIHKILIELVDALDHNKKNNKHKKAYAIAYNRLSKFIINKIGLSRQILKLPDDEIGRKAWDWEKILLGKLNEVIDVVNSISNINNEKE